MNEAGQTQPSSLGVCRSEKSQSGDVCEAEAEGLEVEMEAMLRRGQGLAMWAPEASQVPEI